MNQMQHYREAKIKHPGMVLLFRADDSYELYSEDAVAAATILSLCLTRRADNETGEQVSVAGFPRTSLETHLRQLLRAGQRVAICDQVDDFRSEKKAENIQRTLFDAVD